MPIGVNDGKSFSWSLRHAAQDEAWHMWPRGLFHCHMKLCGFLMAGTILHRILSCCDRRSSHLIPTELSILSVHFFR